MEEVKVFIEGGFILLAKNIIEDEIWEKPPMYLKVWIWILSHAEYRTDNKRMKRGEVHIDVNEIREGCSHYVGYRLVTPTYKEIYRIIEWLKNGDGDDIYEREHEGETKGNMIAHAKGNTKGKNKKVYRVRNYNVYQTSENYERKHEREHEGEHERTTKGKRKGNLLLDKELKEYKEERREESPPILNSEDTLKNNTENQSSDRRQFSKDYSEVIQFMENSGFGVISANVYEDLEYWLKTFDKDMLKKAATIADKNNAPRFSYMEGILRSWKNRKHTSLQDVEASEKQFNAQRSNKKQDPEKEAYIQQELENIRKRKERQAAIDKELYKNLDTENIDF